MIETVLKKLSLILLCILGQLNIPVTILWSRKTHLNENCNIPKCFDLAAMAVHQYHVQSTSNSCSKSQNDLLTDPMFNPVNVEAVSLLLSSLP